MDKPNAREDLCYLSVEAIGIRSRRIVAPFVATLVDVTGLVIYFSVALLVLRGTLL